MPLVLTSSLQSFESVQDTSEMVIVHCFAAIGLVQTFAWGIRCSPSLPPMLCSAFTCSSSSPPLSGGYPLDLAIGYNGFPSAPQPIPPRRMR